MSSRIGSNQLVRLLGAWAVGDGALHYQLGVALRNLVRSGSLPGGARLPSERTLASTLDTSRTTVALAFEALRSDGLFMSRRGDGTYVSTAGQHGRQRGDDRLSTFVDAPGPRSDRIDLRSAALPGLELVAEEFDRMDLTMLRAQVRLHGYQPSGLFELRQAVADYYGALGLATSVEQVLITSGAQQALRLMATSLLEPGATVLIEEPSFRGAIEVLRRVGARLVPVPSGPCGIDVEVLATALRRHRVALVVLQSTVHNPTGSVLPEQGRAAVASLAAAAGVPVLDDIAPCDTQFDGPTPRPLASHGGPIFTLGSTSKAFWGGLRVGWVRADLGTVTPLTLLKSGEDLGTSLLAQVVATHLLPRIGEARTARANALITAKSALLEVLASALPDWEPQVPSGGASMWVRLPFGSATAFAQHSDRCGVAVLPGPTFSSVDGLDDHLRVAFAAPISELLAGVERLASAWHEFAAHPRD